MRIGTKIYHFHSGPPVRHDPYMGSTNRRYENFEVAFTELSVSGLTLTDLLDSLPVGSQIVKRAGGWQVSDGDLGPLGIGEDLPQLLEEIRRG